MEEEGGGDLFVLNLGFVLLFFFLSFTECKMSDVETVEG